MKFTLESIRTSNCPNIWHELLANGELHGAIIIVDDALAEATLKRCPPGTQPEPWKAAPVKRQPAAPTKPLPRESWPLWVKALALVAKPEDKGIGDVLARIISLVGGKAYNAFYLKTFGQPCGCIKRQNALNGQYPLPRV
ncbi:MAG: hypothetical protein KGL39_13385 [Patescibacteria group bacterium]|nr:hypothetical protein [Patescibacteria group bacterium]